MANPLQMQAHTLHLHKQHTIAFENAIVHEHRNNDIGMDSKLRDTLKFVITY